MRELELIIIGDEGWTREEWDAARERREKRTAAKRAYNARPDVKERTRQWSAEHREERRAYNREWMRRYRAHEAHRLVGSLHDLACSGPTRETGCVCHKIRCYSRPVK